MARTSKNPPTIWTIGHSTRPIEELLKLLAAGNIKLLADVRRYPGSRRHPQFNQDALAASLADVEIEYRHFVDLGGRRSQRLPDSPNTAWRVAQFNAGEPWDYVAGSKIEGGHYVPVVGSLQAADQASAITWGKRQVFTREFYERYNDEAWAYITPEALRSDGTGLHGFDLEKLNAYLRTLRRRPAFPETPV